MTDTTEQINDTEVARELLAAILERMQIGAEVKAEEVDQRITLDIHCTNEDDVQRIIGRRGQVVDALQHLVGKMLGRMRHERGKPIVVDAGGYRQKQIDRLEALAERMADKCRQGGHPVDLNAMTPHDRRIVHMALADVDDVRTESEGQGEDRHVVILPV